MEVLAFLNGGRQSAARQLVVFPNKKAPCVLDDFMFRMFLESAVLVSCKLDVDYCTICETTKIDKTRVQRASKSSAVRVLLLHSRWHDVFESAC